MRTDQIKVKIQALVRENISLEEEMQTNVSTSTVNISKPIHLKGFLCHQTPKITTTD